MLQTYSYQVFRSFCGCRFVGCEHFWMSLTDYVSWGAICRLFCCPPFPSKIAAKLAFMPPKPASYEFIPVSFDANKYVIEFQCFAEWALTEEEVNYLEPGFVQTSKRNRIAVLHFNIHKDPKFTIIYSHGNAVDLGIMASFLCVLGIKLGCNVVSYDYSGYGISQGVPSEANIYSDILAVYEHVVNTLKVPANKVILYGQSIGSVPTVDLATKKPIAGVVLHSPLSSGLRVAFPQRIQRTYCCDPFANIEKCHRIDSHTLVIHGRKDEVVDFRHGEEIHKKLPNGVEPLWVTEAGHNDIEIYKEYLARMHRFVEHDLLDPMCPTNSTDAKKNDITTRTVHFAATSSGGKTTSPPAKDGSLNSNSNNNNANNETSNPADNSVTAEQHQDIPPIDLSDILISSLPPQTDTNNAGTSPGSDQIETSPLLTKSAGNRDDRGQSVPGETMTTTDDKSAKQNDSAGLDS